MSVTTGDEQVAIYDRDGGVIGSAPRRRMRAEGLWHAAASVLVRSTDLNAVYVHRRTADKDVYPGMYDCWAGGVVAADEHPDTTARRELAEELGVGSAARFLFRTRHELGSIRFHAFLYETFWDGPIIHQPAEVAEGRWMPLPELRRHLDDPDRPLVPDGRQFVEEWFEFRGR